MKKSLILILTFFLYFDNISTQTCYKSDLCEIKNLGDKIKYFVSPLINGCDFDNYINFPNFIHCTDTEFTNCGYISEPHPDEGVKIALGFDLSKVNNETLIKAKVPHSTIDKLSPFLGLKGKYASRALEKQNLTIFFAEAQQFSYAMMKYHYKLLESEYDEDIKNGTSKFASLSFKKRATLLSLYHDLNGIKQNKYELWREIIKSDWEKVSDLIHKMRYPVLKRKAEYLNLKSDINTSDRKTDTMIIYGNEGLILPPKFEVMRKFFVDYIEMTNLMSNRLNFGTANREKLTTVQDHFSSLKEELYSLIENNTTFPFIKDNYDLSLAIEKGVEKFKSDSNFNDARKTIVLISNMGEGGVSKDDWTKIKEKADVARHAGINIVAILQDYIPSYYNRMLDIAEDSSNIIHNLGVYESDFVCSNVTLYSKICPYFNDEIEIEGGNQILNGYVKSFDAPVFYKVTRGNSDKHQQVILFPTNDFLRDVKVSVFLSFSNPYPDRDFNDMAHLGNNQGNKTLTISWTNTSLTNNTLYLGVYSQKMGYNITFVECDPMESSCQIGTNDIEEEEALPDWAVLFIIIFSSFMLVGIIFITYHYLRGKKATDFEFAKLKEESS